MRALLDSLLAALLITLAAWRMTGIPIHEVLGAVLAALLLFHLLLHPNLFAGRRAVHAILNVALSGAMIVAIASGFAASKWLVPVQHTPGAYLRWHKIHDTSSHLVVLIAGLHVGMNWRRLFGKLPLRPIGRRLAPVAIPIAFVAGATWMAGSLLPPVKTIQFVTPDGTMHPEPPPKDIVMLRRDQRDPDPRRGVVPLAAMGVLFLAGAGVSATVKAMSRS